MRLTHPGFEVAPGCWVQGLFGAGSQPDPPTPKLLPVWVQTGMWASAWDSWKVLLGAGTGQRAPPWALAGVGRVKVGTGRGGAGL